MWFTENAWPPIIICLILAVLLLIRWQSNPQRSLLVGGVILLALCVVFYVTEQSIVTTREFLEQRVIDFTTTFRLESNEPNSVIQKKISTNEIESLDFISDQSTPLKILVATALMNARVHDDLDVKDIIVEVTAQDTRAVTYFRANTTITVPGYSGYQPSRWRVRWRLEAGEWKVTEVDKLDFMTGEVEPIPLPNL